MINNNFKPKYLLKKFSRIFNNFFFKGQEFTKEENSINFESTILNGRDNEENEKYINIEHPVDEFMEIENVENADIMNSFSPTDDNPQSQFNENLLNLDKSNVENFSYDMDSLIEELDELLISNNESQYSQVLFLTLKVKYLQSIFLITQFKIIIIKTIILLNFATSEFS